MVRKYIIHSNLYGIPKAGKEENGEEEASNGYRDANVGNNLQGLVGYLHKGVGVCMRDKIISNINTMS